MSWAHVALRPVCEALGLDFSSQRHRLKRKTWACAVIMTTQMPGDDQRRDVTFLDRRTFTMWLATIGPRLAGPRGNRVV